MAFSNLSSLFPIDAINAINSSTFQWGLQSLPTNLSIFNSSVPNNTHINGQLYNGSAINGTTVIVRFPSTTVGNIGTISFVYMIISLTVLTLMIYPFGLLLRALLDPNPYGLLNSQRLLNRLPPEFTQRPAVSQRQFGKRLRGLYTRVVQRSYIEAIPPGPDDQITAQDLRKCRELIRSRYSLDVRIYNSRGAFNQIAVNELRRRAEGAVVDLHQMIQGWVDGGEDRWEPDQWILVRRLHRRVEAIVENNNHRREP